MVGYWSALHYWNLTEQVLRVTCVQTTARKENRKPRILGMRFRIVRVKLRKFFGCHTYPRRRIPGRCHGSREDDRGLPRQADLSGGVGQVRSALLEGDGDVDWDRMTICLRRFGSGAVVKRLGFLVETLELAHPPDPRLIDEWRDLLSAGISKLDPSTPRAPHRIATRWRIAVNLREEGLARRR